jgi:hypothetical protein
MIPLPNCDECPSLDPISSRFTIVLVILQVTVLAAVILDAVYHDSVLWRQIRQNAKLLAGALLSVLVLGQFFYAFLPNSVGLLAAIGLGIWLGRANPGWIED